MTWAGNGRLTPSVAAWAPARISSPTGRTPRTVRQHPAARYRPVLSEGDRDLLRRRGSADDAGYFDPGYQIRSRPANCEDAVLCDQFARQAVHAAMAGKTGLVIGFLHGVHTRADGPDRFRCQTA